MVKTLHFQCRGHVFNPGSQKFCMPCVVTKKKKLFSSKILEYPKNMGIRSIRDRFVVEMRRNFAWKDGPEKRCFMW